MTIQILLLIISAVVITTYIQPTFKEMQATQNETQEYREALDNAALFNQKLRQLVDKVGSISLSERRTLDRYLPSEVDTIAVMRDIETIVNNNNMVIGGLSISEAESNRVFTRAQGQPSDSESSVTTRTFSLQIYGTYAQFKSLLRDFERNAYPLEISAINFGSASAQDGVTSQIYDFNLSLETYAFGNGEGANASE